MGKIIIVWYTSFEECSLRLLTWCFIVISNDLMQGHCIPAGNLEHPFCECTVQWCKSWHLQEIIGRAGIWKYCNCPSAMVLYSVLYSCTLKILERTHTLRIHLLTFLTPAKQSKSHNAVNDVIVSECVLVARCVPVFIRVLSLLH